MKGLSLRTMSAGDLIDLRDAIDHILAEKADAERRQLQAKLDRLSGFGTSESTRVHPLKGVKVAPRYRGPGGETWSGRGLRPKWLSALVEQGHSPEDFKIQGAPGVADRRRGRPRRS